MIPFINLTGRLVADPELRFTPSGKAVANFRIAENDSKYNEQTRQWEETNKLFITVNVWEALAERVAESLKKGDPVYLNGKLLTREWEQDGNKRSVIELTARDVRLLTRLPQAGQGNTQGSTGGAQGSSQGNAGAAMSNDPWGSAPPAGGFSQQDSEVPF